MTQRYIHSCGTLLLSLFAWIAPLASAQSSNTAPAEAATLKAQTNPNLVLRGDARCTHCHNETTSPNILLIGQTKHGTRADGRTPPACTACHGESRQHVNAPEEPPGSTVKRPRPDVLFGARRGTDIALRNYPCLACHERDAKRSHWDGSAHQAADVACVDCHKVHTNHDKVRDRRTQPEVCVSCHKEQRNEFSKPSHHPVPEGKMSCTDCHSPHGGTGPKMLRRDSVNDTCYTCHAEKRGPFVHQHQPVAEDCGHCHNPHGTVAESMLKARPPFLCHQCHTPHGSQIPQLMGQGQGSALLGPTSNGRSGINITQGRGCVNCHTQIHGSNNPAATNPTPKTRFR